MLTTKFGSCPKIIKLATIGYNYGKHYQICLPIFRLYSLKNVCCNSHICALTKGINENENSVFNFSQTKILRYSTKPLEVPPPPPEETEVFGTLGGLKYEKVDLDKEELEEEERSKHIGQVPRKFKPSPGQYAQMIKNYLDKGDLNSAEEVINECKRNRDKPTDYMYTLLIRANAGQGNIKKCFEYYSTMRARRYKIKDNTYTSLFNACANCPDPEKALNYLERIREHMDKKELKLNKTHYNVLVKAYGRHNKLEEASKLIKIMKEKKLSIGISTINSLMYAANSNMESGLKHILHIWQLMRSLRIPPDIFSYNLLLRGIRDTNFGNCTIYDLLLPYTEYPAIVTDDNRPDLLLYPPVISSLPLDNIERKNTTDSDKLLCAPESESKDPTDITSLIPATSTALNKSSIELPSEIVNIDLDAVLKQNKLILFGGLEGLIQKMKYDKIEANVKTVTYLIELVPGSVAAEETVIKYAKSQKIPLDIDFFNSLIKKRSMRGDKKAAMNVLDDIHKADLKPNIMTYGVLALACRNTIESRELLKAMKITHHTINKYVADTFLTLAFEHRDFVFILELMQHMKYERVRLDEQTFEKFDEFQQKMTHLVKMKDSHAQKDKFKVGFSKFNLRYKSWQNDMGRKIVVERASKESKN